MLIINRLLSIEISSGHNFGSSQVRLDEETEGCQQLSKTVAYLESAVLLQLLGECEYSLRTTQVSLSYVSQSQYQLWLSSVSAWGDIAGTTQDT